LKAIEEVPTATLCMVKSSYLLVEGKYYGEPILYNLVFIISVLLNSTITYGIEKHTFK